jgi:hypothetical protein
MVLDVHLRRAHLTQDDVVRRSKSRVPSALSDVAYHDSRLECDHGAGVLRELGRPQT